MKKSTKVFKCSDPSKNIYGLTVRTAGIKMDGFDQNPVCLYNHDYKVVLGAWTDYQTFGTDLTGVPMFDTENEVANNYYGQVERGVIKGASIGIIPIKVVGNEIVESELLEISITPVPANRSALVLYDNKGVRLSAKDAKTFLLSVEQDNEKLKINSDKMNKTVLAALLALSAQAGNVIALSTDADDDALVGALQSIGNKLTALNLSVTNLTAANQAYELKDNAAKLLDKTTILNLAVQNKQITESQRDTFSQLYDANPELCKSTLETLKPVNLSVSIPGAQAAAEDATKDAYTFDDYAEKAPLELSAMQISDPAKFQKLYEAKVAGLKSLGAIAQ